MHAARLHAPRQLTIEAVEPPHPGPGEAVLEVRAAAVCGSDINAYRAGHPQVTYPGVLGHEFSGVVVAVGDGREDVRVGDRVFCDPTVFCGTCAACRVGRVGSCLAGKSIGFGLDGAFSERVLVPKTAQLFPLPDVLSFEQGSLLQPLGVAHRAVCTLARVACGESVAIIGAGAIGLNALLLAKACGARVIVADVVPRRLEMARALGADHVVDARGDAVQEVLQATGGDGADKVFEVVGGHQTATVELAVRMARPAGTVCIVGSFEGNRASFPVFTFKNRELTMIGSQGCSGDMAASLALVLDRRLDPVAMVTHRVPLADFPEAMALADAHPEQVVKSVVLP